MIHLHYWPTPNGKKVTILLEELGMPYTIAPVNIGKGDQFTEAFLKIGPNNRMPAMVDDAPADGGAPISVFEFGRDHDVPFRKGRAVLSAGPPPPLRGQPVGPLADGQSGTEVRRMRAFPPSRRQAGRPVLRRPPLHRRGEPPLRRPQQPALRPALHRRRRLHHRRHDQLSVDGRTGRGRARTLPSSSISSAGSTSSAPARPCSAGSPSPQGQRRTSTACRRKRRIGA